MTKIHICTTYNTVGPHIVHITVTRKKFWIQWYESYHAQNSSKSSEKLHLFFYLPTLLQRLHYVRTWCTLQRYIWDINFLWLMHKYFSKLTDFYHINDVIDYNVFETLFFNFLSKNWYVSLKKISRFLEGEKNHTSNKEGENWNLV